jgi:hypothetical protein
MDIDLIKKEIVATHKEWDKLGQSLDDGQSFDDDKYAEMYEGGVWDMLFSYCENKEYEVEGYPFEKRLLAETNPEYDEDYFCFERNMKYIEILATQKPDVIELLFFFKQTFWYDETATLERLKEELLEGIAENWCDIDF